MGDNEGFHFVEAVRQMRIDEGAENVLYVHVVFLPHLEASNEIKTKPAQNSVKELRNIGIQPDILIARADHPVGKGAIEKLSLYTNVDKEAILPLETVPSIYAVPLIMEEHNLDEVIMKKLALKPKKRTSKKWQTLVDMIAKDKPKLQIAMVGKYTTMMDTYASLVDALKAACWQSEVDLDLQWIDAEDVEKTKDIKELFEEAKGIVVPGGFGIRGTEGMIQAIQYARENKIPYLELCLGMQLAVVEFARNVAGIQNASSEEFDKKNGNNVIHIMETQKTVKEKGGTMRLGGWDCKLNKESKTYKAYGKQDIRERHRHRFEFNNDFREQLEEKGLLIAGTTPDNELVEVIEIKEHPWFVAVQFHPEFTSRPTDGHPLFNDFIKATKK